MSYLLELEAIGDIMAELRKLQKNLITANTAQLKVGKYEYGPQLKRAEHAAAYNNAVVNRSRPQVLKTVEQRLKHYNEKYNGTPNN